MNDCRLHPGPPSKTDHSPSHPPTQRNSFPDAAPRLEPWGRASNAAEAERPSVGRIGTDSCIKDLEYHDWSQSASSATYLASDSLSGRETDSNLKRVYIETCIGNVSLILNASFWKILGATSASDKLSKDATGKISSKSNRISDDDNVRRYIIQNFG